MNGFLYGFLIFIEVLSSLLLIGIILLQKTKDEGLGLAFGAGVGETLFGSRAGSVLTRITVTLAGIFLLNTLAIGYIAAGKAGSGSVIDRLPTQQAAPVQSAPASQAPVSIPGGVGESMPAPAPVAAPIQAPTATTP